jgi:hypothetical protein
VPKKVAVGVVTFICSGRFILGNRRSATQKRRIQRQLQSLRLDSAQVFPILVAPNDVTPGGYLLFHHKNLGLCDQVFQQEIRGGA